MQRKTSLSRLLLASALLVLLSARCCMVGLGIGAVVDASSPTQVEIPAQRLEDLGPGTPITLVMKDGRELIGNDSRLGHVADEGYHQAYNNFLKNISAPFPEFGDRVTVIMATGARQKGQFLGFDSRHIVLKEAATKSQEILIDLNQINKILNSDGSHINSVTISEFMATGGIPLLPQSIIFSDTTGWHQIALEKVHKIYIHPKKRGKLTGFIIGAILDAFFWYRVSQTSFGVSIGSF